jgi:hypothetical protein
MPLISTTASGSSKSFRSAGGGSNFVNALFQNMNTGRYGPSLAQAQAGTTGTGVDGWKYNTEFFNVISNNIITLKLPSGNYRIVCVGAAGGDGYQNYSGSYRQAGGYGAYIQGDLSLSAATYCIVVGQKGSDDSVLGQNWGGGGGGGTFFWQQGQASAPIIAAAGGGGGGGGPGGQYQAHGQTGMNASYGQSNSTSQNAAPGYGGAGNYYPGGQTCGGGSGQGWNGGATQGCGGGYTWEALYNNPTGYNQGGQSGNNGGGFGGGAGSYGGAGGGGGYSGGGGGGWSYAGYGGGGGSYPAGSNQNNIMAYTSGGGWMSILKL